MNDGIREPTGNDSAQKPPRPVTHKIKEWRAFRKMTCQQLGEAAKLTASLISQIELGKSAYSQNSLEALARGLHCEPWELLGRDPRNGWAAMMIGDTEPHEFWDGIAEKDHAKVK